MRDSGGCPKLSRKVRLRPDRLTGQVMLLYPERGLLLNGTAADIAALCTGEHDVCEIVRMLTERYEGLPGGVIEEETHSFLEELARRGLLEWSRR